MKYWGARIGGRRGRKVRPCCGIFKGVFDLSTKDTLMTMKAEFLRSENEKWQSDEGTHHGHLLLRYILSNRHFLGVFRSIVEVYRQFTFRGFTLLPITVIAIVYVGIVYVHRLR